MINVSMSPDLSGDFQSIIDHVTDKTTETKSHVTTKNTDAKNTVVALVSSESSDTQIEVGERATSVALAQTEIDINQHVTDEKNALLMAVNNKFQMVPFRDYNHMFMLGRSATLNKTSATFTANTSWSVVNHSSNADIYHVYADVNGKSGGFCGVLSADNNNLAAGMGVYIKLTIDGEVSEYFFDDSGLYGYQSQFLGFVVEQAEDYPDKMSIGNLLLMRSKGLYIPFENSLKVEVKLPTKPRTSGQEEWGFCGYFTNDDMVTL